MGRMRLICPMRPARLIGLIRLFLLGLFCHPGIPSPPALRRRLWRGERGISGIQGYFLRQIKFSLNVSGVIAREAVEILNASQSE